MNGGDEWSREAISVLGDALGRYGLIRRRAEFHLWIHGEALGDFEGAAELLGELARREPRYRLLLTVPGGAARRALRRRFRGARVLPPPVNVEYAVRRFMVAHRVHGLVLLEAPRELGGIVFALARWFRVPVVAVTAGAREPSPTPGVHWVGRNAEALSVLSMAGVPSERMTSASDDASAVAAVVRRLRDGRGIPDRGAPVGLSRRWRRLVATRAWQAALALRTERLADPSALRAALGTIGTLLCLGNGPSSEDPRLGDVRFDVLFRVNWAWRSRGVLTRPDVVFAAVRDYPAGVGRPILGFRTIQQEARVLRRRALAPRPWRVRYFTLDRWPGAIGGRGWPARPTNGAVMIATAAALAPARLIIAGMDLYAHPDGAYPGDAATANAYPLMHDRETELAIVEAALRDFHGEVVILSEPLRRALAERSR